MLNNLECPAIPELANECRDLLRQWQGKEITSDFDISICEISCKHQACIDDFRWRPEPSCPEEYGKYKSLRPKDKDIFRDQNPTFFVRGKVFEYLETRDRIIMLNKRNIDILRGWSKLAISDDARIKVDRCLNTFSGRGADDSANKMMVSKF
jgi:hypothetical protein